MTSQRFALVVSAVLFASAAHAATERPADPPAGPTLMAGVDVSVPMVRTGTAAGEVRATSAGVAEALPEPPSAQTVALLLPSRLHLAVPASTGLEAVALPDSPNISTLQASPLRGAARMVRAERFNTEDGSSADAFAICYRLNGRSSVQVIPGDPAPVKIPVSSMANNTGVTVGMVLRLSKTR